MGWRVTPLEHLPRSLVESRTGKEVWKRWLRRVDLPEAWVPKMQMFRLAFGYLWRDGLGGIWRT